ncbi:hypothetical protein NQ318_016638 [Aromia moschata]|uniref:Uncharacterized protein n=1 Tax=Aromia moschata TaxID=1265417 RepID=A0AAV8XUM2_9CUCU|nr:hypothetical protein NQ318_016638 [Aromia moschata]
MERTVLDDVARKVLAIKKAKARFLLRKAVGTDTLQVGDCLEKSKASKSNLHSKSGLISKDHITTFITDSIPTCEHVFVLQFREMVYLTEMHKIPILQMIGYGDRIRTQALFAYFKKNIWSCRRYLKVHFYNEPKIAKYKKMLELLLRRIASIFELLPKISKEIYRVFPNEIE